MSIKKQYLKSKNICKVTFTLPKKSADSAKKVFLVGDFNDWKSNSAEMNALKNGNHKTTLELEPGHEYQFRYFLGGKKWVNDDSADKYVPNKVSGEDNSVVVV
ncbi:MAG: isoamylase early set domain-containing protein [Bacteroidota bacterium]